MFYLSSSLEKVFTQSGFAQRGPKVVLSSHVVSFALALPMIFSRFFYVPVPPMLVAWATGYFTTLTSVDIFSLRAFFPIFPIFSLLWPFYVYLFHSASLSPLLWSLLRSKRFQRPSERVLFSDEGDLKGTWRLLQLEGSLKGFKKASRRDFHLKGA